MFLEGAPQLRSRRPVDAVPTSLEVTHGAPRHVGALGEFALRPVQEPACRAAECGGQ